ncbi:MAG: hypothetical protein WCO57_00690 [Verrucomicrobiota bacterium]
MIRILPVLLSLLALVSSLGAAEFTHFASFILKSHFKVAGDKITPVPMKPIVFHVSTDGTRVHVTAEGDNEARTTFDIYRSDGIARQRPGEVTLDVMPGIQAMSHSGGVLRHLRLTRESFTLTTFPGVSDQTVITHALATTPSPPAPAPISVQSAPHKP